MAEIPDSDNEPVLGTPGIREIRSENFGFGNEQSNGEGGKQERGGTRKVGLRAEIDTSPPFGSVKEAVTRFGGSGSWMPYYYRIGESYGQGVDNIDIKKVEEQAAELEKHLIVKELETLDVLEQLGTTKKAVEELKRQLQKETLRCMTPPPPVPDEAISSPSVIKQMNKESCSFHGNNLQHCRSSFCASTPSPDLILMELKQAKLNLGKTINDLGVIQTSVESLDKKMKKEKTFLQNTRERLTSKFAGVLSLEEELKQARMKPRTACGNVETCYKEDKLKKMDGAANVKIITDIGTAELRLLAAKKMEEAARAAEAVALAEIKALSADESPSQSALPQREKAVFSEAPSPLTPKLQKPGGIRCQKDSVEALKLPGQDFNFTKMSIMKKLREATEEVKQSKHALEEALNKVESANRKQLSVEEALHKWMPEDDQEVQGAYYATRVGNFHLQQPDHEEQDSPLNDANNSNLVNNDLKPVLRSTVSMRDVLSRKQILPEEYVAARPTEGRMGRQKVALSQMLHELREDLAFQPRAEKNRGDQKQFYAQRRKFGFIHISLPMTKPSKRKVQDLNNMSIG